MKGTGSVRTRCFINFELGHEDVQFSTREGRIPPVPLPSRTTLVNCAFYSRSKLVDLARETRVSSSSIPPVCNAMTFSEESTKIDKLLERTRYFRYIELFYTRRVVYVTQFAREELIRDSHKYFLILSVMYRNFKSKISFLGYKIVTVVSKFISEILFNQSKIKEYYFVTYDE